MLFFSGFSVVRSVLLLLRLVFDWLAGAAVKSVCFGNVALRLPSLSMFPVGSVVLVA